MTLIPRDSTTSPRPVSTATGWRHVRLGDVCRVVGGSTPRSGEPDFWNGDIVWITPTDLGRLDAPAIIDSARHITSAGYESCGTEMLPVGAVVMSSRAPIGHLGIATVPLCTNQGCKSFVPGPKIDAPFLLHLLRSRVEQIRAIGSGATFPEVSKTQLENFSVEIPPLSEQRRLAKQLDEQLEVLERATRAASARLRAAQRLPGSLLQSVFYGPDSGRWRTTPLNEIAELLPSKSVASDGDTEVQTVTTACLTEEGFRPDGVKTARMRAADAHAARLSPGEILIARSNTPELVGRAALYAGEPAGLVASDLTIRVLAGKTIEPAFLGSYLTGLYLSGYWRERAGGASGTMKKITRTQILALPVPVPTLEEQRRVVARLCSALTTATILREGVTQESTSLSKTHRALLRVTFKGSA